MKVILNNSVIKQFGRVLLSFFPALDSLFDYELPAVVVFLDGVKWDHVCSSIVTWGEQGLVSRPVIISSFRCLKGELYVALSLVLACFVFCVSCV